MSITGATYPGIFGSLGFHQMQIFGVTYFAHIALQQNRSMFWFSPLRSTDSPAAVLTNFPITRRAVA